MPVEPKLIAFDLDGTLLADDKSLPEENRRALLASARAGTLLVPATGRVPAGLPAALTEPGFQIRWGIFCNGAEVYDLQAQRFVLREEIALDEALALLDFAETLGLPCDCYQDNWGYMGRAHYERAAEFMPIPGILDLILRLRTPVPELRAYLCGRGESVQKLQLYVTDQGLRARLLKELPERFPSLAVPSSLPVNIEINAARANKGEALRRLCDLLSLNLSETLAFGDGSNDATLLQAAGLGVAMNNADDALKAAADRGTGTNNEAGFAQILREFYTF